ncbi:fimbrial protein [Aeromonas veronii]|nr:fimbrial protein [Aeromonas veronii]
MHLLLTVLAGLVLSQPVAAAKYSEKTQYLGVLNGQVQGNSVVKVTRTLEEPVLYRTQGDDPLPGQLLIRSAEVRPAPGGMAHVSVKQLLSDGRVARLTLKAALMVDAQRKPVMAEQRGEDVVISVPAARKGVELRTDSPVELEVPASYRGSLQVIMQIEGEGALN